MRGGLLQYRSRLSQARLIESKVESIEDVKPRLFYSRAFLRNNSVLSLVDSGCQNAGLITVMGMMRPCILLRLRGGKQKIANLQKTEKKRRLVVNSADSVEAQCECG
jgi:hypothetical protein